MKATKKVWMAEMKAMKKVSMAGIRATMTWIFSKKVLNKATNEPCRDSPARHCDAEHNTTIGDFELGYYFDISFDDDSYAN